MTEILLPRIARQGAVCLISMRGQTRTARIEKFELEKLELINLSSMRVSNCIIPPSGHTATCGTTATAPRPPAAAAGSHLLSGNWVLSFLRWADHRLAWGNFSASWEANQGHKVQPDAINQGAGLRAAARREDQRRYCGFKDSPL